jgi:hypothetical protein
VAVSVHVALVVAGSAEHRRRGVGGTISGEHRRNEDAVCVSRDRLKHEESIFRPVEEEDASMAAPEDAPAEKPVGAEI